MSSLNSEDFAAAVGAGVVLVDFWAEWCGPCRMLGPVIEELGVELAGRVGVYKCNVDDCPDLAKKFNVRSIPTLILFKDGEVVDTSVGTLSKSVLRNWVESKL
ncbi:MAG: thioredoxin [Rickettsiales bacterium]|jgi:thioredoxin 1|nr:thioredoxin [Rickettsiales bacterium]